jgi:phosphohistidine phosphatase
MKLLILGRHSDADYSGQDDYSRPLSDIGQQHLLQMQVRLRDRLVNRKPNIIASGAARTRETALGYAEELGIAVPDIDFDAALYSNGNSYYLEKIQEQDDLIDTLIIIGHNPVIPSLATYCSGEHLQMMPACGFVGIEFSFNSWKNINGENGNICFFDYPR